MTLNLKRYSLVLLAMTLLTTAISYALPFLGIDAPVGMSLWLPPMISALDLAAIATQTDLFPLRDIGTGGLLLALAFAVIVTYVTNRIFLGLGVRQGVKIHASANV